MRKILFVNMNNKTGGIKKSFESLLLQLPKDSDVYLQYFVQPEKLQDIPLGHSVSILPHLFLLDVHYSSFQELKRRRFFVLIVFVKSILKGLRFIIGNERLIRLLLLFSRKIKTEFDYAIAYSHDFWNLTNNSFSGGCAAFVLHNVKAKKKYAWIHGEPQTIGLNDKRARKTFSGFDKVINVSKSCNEAFLKITKGGIPCDFIYNYMDVKQIQKKSNEKAILPGDECFTIITVARINRIKRIDRINPIAKKLIDDGFVFRWIVVGGGEGLESFRQDALNLGIDSFVSYIGEQANPYKYMRKANLFVLLSDSESFSIVVNEALVLGIPVIATDIPAVRETICDGKNGFIVCKKDEAIMKKIEECIMNPCILEKIKENIRIADWANTINKETKAKINTLLGVTDEEIPI